MAGMWIWWLIALLLIVAVVWLIGAAGPRAPVGGPEDAEAVLKRRYARGEIDHDEYRRRLEDLRR